MSRARCRLPAWRRAAIVVGAVVLGGFLGHDVGLQLSASLRSGSAVIWLDGMARGGDAWLGAGIGALLVGAVGRWLASGTCTCCGSIPAGGGVAPH